MLHKNFLSALFYTKTLISSTLYQSLRESSINQTLAYVKYIIALVYGLSYYNFYFFMFNTNLLNLLSLQFNSKES